MQSALCRVLFLCCRMINPQDENELRGLLLLADDQPVPDELEAFYDRVRRMRARRYGGPMALDLLIAIVIHAGFLPEEAPKVQADSGETYRKGDEVEVFRGDVWVPGQVVSKGKNGIHVRLEGDEAPWRAIKPANIRALACEPT